MSRNPKTAKSNPNVPTNSPAIGDLATAFRCCLVVSAATGDRRQLPVCLEEFEDVVGAAVRGVPGLGYEETAIITSFPGTPP
jgi:hypothetical protein